MNELVRKELREWGLPIALVVLLASAGWRLADWNDVFLGPDEGPTLALLFFGCPLAAFFGWWQHRKDLARGLVPYLAHRRGGAQSMFLAKCTVGIAGALVIGFLPLAIAYAWRAWGTPFGPVMQGLRLFEYFWTSFGLVTAYAAGAFVAHLRRGLRVGVLLVLLAGLGAALLANAIEPPALQGQLWTMPVWALTQVFVSCGLLLLARRIFVRGEDRETMASPVADGLVPLFVTILCALPGAVLLGSFWDDASTSLLSSYPRIAWDRAEQRYLAIEDVYPRPYQELDEARRSLREIARDPTKPKYYDAHRFDWGTQPLTRHEGVHIPHGLSTWGFERSSAREGELTRCVVVDAKLGRLRLWRIWQRPEDRQRGSWERSAIRTEELPIEPADGEPLSAEAEIVVAEDPGDFLIFDPRRASFWRLDETARSAPTLRRVFLPGQDRLLRLEQLCQRVDTPIGERTGRAGLLFVGESGRYEYGADGFTAWTPGGAHFLENEIQPDDAHETRDVLTGAFAWRFEARDPSTGDPVFRFSVQPQTTGEKLRAGVLDLLQVLRPPIRPVMDLAGVPLPRSSAWQRRHLLTSLLGPSFPRTWQLLHLLVALAAGALCTLRARRRSVRGRAAFAWGCAGFVGGVLALPILWLVMPPERSAEPAPSLAPSAGNPDRASMASGGLS